MVIVKLRNPNTNETKEIYMDGKLHRQLKKKVLNSLKKEDEDYVLLVDGNERGGKCQPQGSKILMANGNWKRIENIRKGDYVLSPQKNGRNTFAKVTNLNKWFSFENYDVVELNKSKRKLYTCSSNHQFPINKCSTPRLNKSGSKRGRDWKINEITAQNYLNMSYELKKNSTAISSYQIQEFKDRQNCKVEPYSLGVFLGDGSFSSIRKMNKHYKGTGTKGVKKGKYQGFQLHRQLSITSSDFEIMEEVSKYYPIQKIHIKKDNKAKMYRFSLLHDFSKLLTKYGLEGKGSGTKFIPKSALLSNIEYRTKLLAGLIDTDGYLSQSQGYSITTKSQRLAEGILFLVYSLGGRGNIRKIKKGIKKLNFVGEYYHVCFYLGNLKLPLKVIKKIKTSSCVYLSPNRVSINVIPSKPCKVYGLEIESLSKWYITDNWMVTHNSTITQQIGCVIDPTLIGDLSRICFTPDEFRKAILNAKKGQCIIFDEAYRGLAAKGALTEVNRILVSLMMEMGQRNLFIIIVLPTFFLLEKYVAIWRARGLIHTYKDRKGKKGRWIYFNSKKKKILYLMGKRDYNYNVKGIKSSFRGRFLKGYMVNDKAYRDKKALSLKTGYTVTRQEKFMEQRNGVIRILYEHFGLSQQEISRLCYEYDISLKRSGVRDILKKFRKKDENAK